MERHTVAGQLCLARTPSALPFNELRSCAGYPNRRRASLVALRPYRSHRPRMLNRALAVARAFLTIFASRTDLVLENLALRQQLAVLQRKHPRPWSLRVRSTLLAGPARRVLMHSRVTSHPTAAWIRQQLREAFLSFATIEPALC